MNSLWDILKDFNLLKTYLRILKSDFSNYFHYKSQQISSIKLKHPSKTNPSISNPENDLKEDLKDNLDNLFSKKLKVAFIVTENRPDASAGDYFTAMEFGEGLKEFGWDVTFLSKKGLENWYYIEEDVNFVISMLDVYDPRKIKSNNDSIVKIAWTRNWFDRWAMNPGFSDYDIILASSTRAVNYIKTKTGRETLLLPIATNSKRFNSSIIPCEEYSSDYCFTGSYWNDPRDIMGMLDPQNIPYKFNLYGKNWENVDKFKKYYKGFINYSEMPKIYASTKIVIDDANRATKDFGAVNSRVFDALASGALVLTNGKIGAEETFNGNLPVFNSKEELSGLIKYYLINEEERLNKINELQKYVLENHTYINRANTLKKILNINQKSSELK